MSDPMNDVRVVEAGRGASWWAEGWHTFRSGLWTWIGIMIIYIIITVLISIVPYVGDVGHSLLAPVFIGGLMLGCRAIDRDEPLKVAHLFEGFQGEHFVPLLIIGAIDIALTLLLTAILAGGVLGGGSLLEMMRYGASDPMAMMSRSAGAAGMFGLVTTLAALVMVAVIGALNWFAPALVVLHGAKSIDAMKTSFVAMWRNWLPFLVYGLVALAIGVGMLLVVGGLSLMFGLSLFAGTGIIGMIGVALLFAFMFALLALVMGPIVFGSTYAGYSDTLADQGDGDTGNPAYH